MIPSDLRDKLANLDPNDLIDFIVGLQNHDDAIDRKIATLVAHLDASAESQRLATWIDSLARRRFVDWRRNAAFANEVEDLVDAMEALAEQRPAGTLDVADRLLRAGPRLIESTDDSSGSVSFALRRAYVVWLQVAARQRQQESDSTDWVARVRELHANDDYGLADDLLSNSDVLLNPDELRQLAAHYEADASTTFGHRIALGQVAIALRDAGLYARSVSMANDEVNEMQKANIVETCLRLDALDEALVWIDEPWKDEAQRMTLRAKVFAARGDRDQEIESRRGIWRLRCSWDALESLLDCVDPDQREPLIAEAIERAKTADLRQGLNILLQLDRVGDAAELAIDRHQELESMFYGSLADIAEEFERQGQDLAATLAYRALLDDILGRGYRRAYHHAARYYTTLNTLSRAVDDWRDLVDHAAYVDGLQDQHSRKRAFWSRVGGLPR